MLKDMQSIDYSWGKVDLEVHAMSRAAAGGSVMALAECSDSYDLNIEPDDLEVSDTVTVVWEIG